ncbi:hypothetical protein PBI_PEREGRIN_12 [Rhodococcus phage Peregrin]|nr:hypothetical protein PBI_PEREGRIN_12 [Rhodococcus phage Peregrin]
MKAQEIKPVATHITLTLTIDEFDKLQAMAYALADDLYHPVEHRMTAREFKSVEVEPYED